jgi:hypothetical protein
MSEPTTYHGSCHCGAVQYEVKAKLEGAVTCNCSICSKTGTVLAFAPAAEFRLISGQDALQDYQFGKKRLHHLFCSRCGVRAFGRGTGPDGSEMVALNLRCVDGVDLSTLPVRQFDGRSRPID